jgi:hypothetical protein
MVWMISVVSGDIGESDLIVIARCETREVRTSNNTQDKKMNAPLVPVIWE